MRRRSIAECPRSASRPRRNRWAPNSPHARCEERSDEPRSTHRRRALHRQGCVLRGSPRRGRHLRMRARSMARMNNTSCILEWRATPSSASTATPAAIRCGWSPAAAPPLDGATMIEQRASISSPSTTGSAPALMFEPRGHDMMSGSILYPPTRADCDVGILFIETSGCLPMCGHGTIGTVTMALENGLVTPKTPGLLSLDTPAGLVEARYEQNGPLRRGGAHHQRRRPSSTATDYEVEVEGLGELVRRRRLWRQFLRHRRAAAELFRTSPTSNPSDILRWSPKLRQALQRSRTRSRIPRTRRSTA